MWTPILDDTSRGAARRLLDEIVASLAGETDRDGSLMHGSAGRALLHAQLARAGMGDDVAGAHLALAAEWLEDGRRAPSFASGWSGVGWAAAHLGGEDLAELDATAARLAASEDWAGRHDLLDGLTGLGVYALEREPAASACLEIVVSRLLRTAIRTRRGATWHTPNTDRLSLSRLGAASGVVGPIAVLAAAAARGHEDARPVVEEAVRWLLGQQASDGTTAGFPHEVWLGGRPTTGRVSWCHGEPGIAVALLGAARALDVPSWARAAIEIGHRAASRKADGAGVGSSGYCHGAAGNAHAFNRLWHATGEAAFADASRRWFDWILSVGLPPPAGGLLSGSIGVALVLLAAIAPVEPEWDRAFLSSPLTTPIAALGGSVGAPGPGS